MMQPPFEMTQDFLQNGGIPGQYSPWTAQQMTAARMPYQPMIARSPLEFNQQSQPGGQPMMPEGPGPLMLNGQGSPMGAPAMERPLTQPMGQPMGQQVVEQMPLLSGQQMQYLSQLAQYNDQQQRYAEWSREAQPQREQAKGQMLGATGAGLLQSDATEVQTGKGATALEESLHARERRVEVREAAVDREALQLKAEELKDKEEEQVLSKRAATLLAKEKQVGTMENALLQEQKKIWRIMQQQRERKAQMQASQQRTPVPQAFFAVAARPSSASRTTGVDTAGIGITEAASHSAAAATAV
jgi:hypothetical protein